ncbi:hypothetical protein MLD38_021186 [Melastoma candidum]|uniref:Uncharacterized protein n=1 Tax=Melastoma candidum TaxID=119954 RepID=A0ACB9QFG6_9MYRT|nr:hypothetical protein MLD38_021186 [Melastoma candidum]
MGHFPCDHVRGWDEGAHFAGVRRGKRATPLCDLGLAKLLNQRDLHKTSTIHGTVGHITPEYLSTGQSFEKTDVLGFEILQLELITG